MSDLAPILIGFFTAGLAGSLHCIGMCGPIVSSVCLVPVSAVRIEGQRQESRTSERLYSAFFGAIPNHLGRILTYAALGALAGAAGASGLGWLRESGFSARLSAVTGWMMIATAGLFLAWELCGGQFKRLAVRATEGAFDGAVERLAELIRAVGRTRSTAFTARMLAGGVMGLLPCGLLYAMLISASVTLSPAKGALAMIAFGLGTVPALSTALVAMASVPVSVRRHGRSLAAALMALLGYFLLWRGGIMSTLAGDDQTATSENACPMCAEGESAGVLDADQ